MPVVLSNIAAVPTAVLESAPVVVRASAPAPTPVLKLASPTKKSEYQPIAVFPMPLPRRARALHPSAVVNAGLHPSGFPDISGGNPACICGKNPNQASTDRPMVNIVRLRFFISLIFLSLFWPCVISVCSLMYCVKFWNRLRRRFGFFKPTTDDADFTDRARRQAHK